MVLFCWMLLIVEDGKGWGRPSKAQAYLPVLWGGRTTNIMQQFGEQTSILTWIGAVRIR